MEASETLAIVTIDGSATSACRQNNEELKERKDVKETLSGGSIQKYRNAVGLQSQCSEFTVSQWRHTAHELILYNMLQEYEATGQASLLDIELQSVGISFYGHREKDNIFQIIYVKRRSNFVY